VSVFLRWYTDGRPDNSVPHPFLTADDGAPLEFPSEEDAVEYIGADLMENQVTGSGWRAVAVPK
jgi:hypothetical protein